MNSMFGLRGREVCKTVLPCAAAIVLLWSCAPLLQAQAAGSATAAKTRVFEVATIKPSDPNDRAKFGQMGFNRDEFMANGQTLLGLIKFAYGLNFGSDDQVIGGPAWLKTANFDIMAKEDEETVAALKNLPGKEQMTIIQPMVQTLLGERFKLKVHHESRVLPVYDLVVAKGGAKFKESVDPKADPDKPARNSWHGLQMNREGANRQMEMRGGDLGMFSDVLTSQPEIGGKMVINKTGLTGKYDFVLKWTPESGMGAQGPNADAGVSTEPAGPSLFTALQDELGLKVEPGKAPVDVIVIDSVEMPSAN